MWPSCDHHVANMWPSCDYLYPTRYRDVLDYLQAMKTRAAKPVSPVTNRTEQIQPSLRTPSQQPPTSSPKVVTPAPGKPPSPPIPGKTPAAPIPGKSPAVPPRTLRYTDIPIDEAQRNRGNSLAQWKVRICVLEEVVDVFRESDDDQCVRMHTHSHIYSYTLSNDKGPPPPSYPCQAWVY